MKKYGVLLFCMTVLYGASLSDKKTTRNEVLRSIVSVLQEVETERRKTRKAVEASAAQLVRLRDRLAGTDDTLHAQIVEAQTVATIAETTALVELVKIDAKKTIDKEVDRLEALRRQGIDTKRLQTEEQKALHRIAQAVAQVEKTKAAATRHILRVTREGELRKLHPVRYADDEAAFRIAQSDAKRRIAEAISAVEIAKELMKVELCRCLSDDDRKALTAMDASHIDLKRIEAKAKAAIAEAKAEPAMSKVKAMEKIVRATATVKIAKWIKGYKKEKKIRITTPVGSYPKSIVKFEKK